MKKQERRIFGAAFGGTLAVLGLLTAGAAFFLRPTVGIEAPVEPQYAVKEKESSYLPSGEEALTVLFIGTEGPQERPGSFLLVGFEPLRGKLPILPLPENLGVSFQGRDRTLGEVYELGGASGAKQAVADTLGISVERYVIVERERFVEAAELIGRASYKLSHPVTLQGPGGEAVIDSGYQQLDGKRAADLLTHRGYPGGELERLRVMGEVTAEILNQRLEVVDSPLVESLFRQLVGFVRTDISFRDFEFRVQAARFLASLQTNPAVAVTVLGEELEGQFLLADTTLRLAGQLFHRGGSR